MSWKKCHYRFCKKKYTVSAVPCNRSVYRMLGKLWMTASVLGRNKMQKVMFLLDQM